MIITNKAILSRWKVKIRRRVIKKVDCIKFLWVMLDNRLNFDRHTLYLWQGGSYSRCHNLPFSLLVNLYKSIIYPHFIYCIPGWGRPGSLGVARIQRIQNGALRVISKYEANHRAVTDALMNIYSIYKCFTSINLYRVLNEGQHSYILIDYVMYRYIIIMPLELEQIPACILHFFG